MSVFHDPVAWSGSIVRTWTRFIVACCFVAAITVLLMYESANRGWTGPWGLAFFVIAQQILFLYALRRLYNLVTRGAPPVGLPVR